VVRWCVCGAGTPDHPTLLLHQLQVLLLLGHVTAPTARHHPLLQLQHRKGPMPLSHPLLLLQLLQQAVGWIGGAGPLSPLRCPPLLEALPLLHAC
jgi:hypothetical protein